MYASCAQIALSVDDYAGDVTLVQEDGDAHPAGDIVAVRNGCGVHVDGHKRWDHVEHWKCGRMIMGG